MPITNDAARACPQSVAFTAPPAGDSREHPEKAQPGPNVPTRSDYLCRRFRRVLNDLSADRALDGWITPTEDGLAFRVLTHQEANVLVLALEDHVVVRRKSPTPGPNQRRLF
jgi:hypothetical protein